MKNFWHSGQSLVELIMVMALLSILVPALLGAIVMSKNGEAQRINRVAAAAFLREAVESVRVIRENSWDTIAINGTYHPVIIGTTWSLAPGAETIEGLTRSIVISDVRRDAAGTIVNTGGTVDPSSKKILVTVAWSLPNPAATTSEFYLTRYLDNLTVIETTTVDFNPGIFEGTTLTNMAGGEVSLGAGGYGDWCSPTLLNPGTNLEGNGIAKGVVAFEGKAYTGTGDNSSGKSLVGINISNTAPPVAVQESTFDGYKTNAIFAESNHAYIGTDTNNREVVIVRVSSLPYAEVGYFDTPNGASGRSVYVTGNTGYVLAGDQLYNFDLSSKTGSRSALDSNGVKLSGNGSQVVISGDYAFVSIEGNSAREMEVINISNPTNLQVVGYANIDGQSSRDIFINSSATRAYIAAAQDSSRREMFIINISSKTGNQPIIGSYDSNGMDPKGITVVPGNRVVLVGHNNEEYQVINIANEFSPVRCGGAQVDVGINAVDSIIEADGDAYSYIVTRDSNAEFRIIAGGPGGGYSTSGTFTSKPFDALYTTAFNYIEAHTTVPNQTGVQYQVAVADAVNNNCADANYVFVGPDGNSSTFYTTEREIYWNDDGIGFENPGRCFKYKVYLETDDSSSTPSFEDMTVNYSP